ncbi:MAG: hypothetical protein IJ274_14445, partial [Lachnospiraceae bacterium]|nr:hypothetical protein [Lachnospiraceae bacterium]
VLASDITHWDSGSVQNVSGVLPLADMELYVSVRRCPDGRTILFANQSDAKGRVYLGKITQLQLQ